MKNRDLPDLSPVRAASRLLDEILARASSFNQPLTKDAPEEIFTEQYEQPNEQAYQEEWEDGRNQR